MSANDPRGTTLIGIARDAIVRADAPLPRWTEGWLEERAATFVTLHLDDELRGCIGSLEAIRALGDDVHANARAAAFRDPRFPPVTVREAAALQVEVSVLSPSSPLAVASESDAVAVLRPGIDGVVLEYEGRRATFLPQVWEGLADPLEFLSHLRLKADLPPRFWHPSIKLSRYTVEKYA
jgi:AmmeMemoRadiSam system protein A